MARPWLTEELLDQAYDCIKEYNEETGLYMGACALRSHLDNPKINKGKAETIIKELVVRGEVVAWPGEGVGTKEFNRERIHEISDIICDVICKCM